MATLIDPRDLALPRRPGLWGVHDVVKRLRGLLPHSLGTRILLGSLVVQVLLFAVLLVHDARLVERALAEQFKLRVQNLKPLLNSALAPLLLDRDYAALNERLRDARSDEDIEYLVLRDANDVQIASAGWDSAQVLPLASKKVIDERGIFHAFLLIESGGRKYGTLNLGLSTTKLSAYRDELQRQGLLMLVLGMLVIGALNAWFAYLVTRTRTSGGSKNEFKVWSPSVRQATPLGAITTVFISPTLSAVSAPRTTAQLNVVEIY